MPPPSPPRVPAAAVAVAAFLGYALTLPPGVPGGDSGELAAAALTMGVPHPTGYPLYTLLARAWLWLYPVGGVAFRLNALSAVLAALAAGAVFVLHRRRGHGDAAAAALALAFAWGPVAWRQAVVAEVYPLGALLAALWLLLLLRWSEEGEPRWLFLAALAAGAQLAHHLTAVFTLAAGALVVLERRRAVAWRRDGWRLALLAALPLLLYLVLPVRSLAGPPVDWGDPETPGALLAHVTGRQYGSKLLPLSLPDVAANARFLAGALFAGPAGALAAAGLAGAVLGARRGGPFGRAVLALVALQGLFCLAYRVLDLESFTLPLLLALNLGLGAGLARAREAAPALAARARGRPAAAALGAGLLLYGAHGAAQVPRERDFVAEGLGADLLDSLPVGARCDVQGDFRLNPLLHAQVVERRRCDVELVSGQNLFRGSIAPRAPGGRSYTADAGLAAGLAPSARRPHGLLIELAGGGGPAAPDPWAVYRPVPTDADLEALGEGGDRLALFFLLNRLEARLALQRERGEDGPAEVTAGRIVETAQRFMGLVVPREDELRYLAATGVRFGRWDVAVAWGEELAARAELEPDLANNLAWAQLQLGDRLARAEELSRSAVGRDPGNAAYLSTLAFVRLARGAPAEAGELMRRAVALAPGDPAVRADAERLAREAAR